jgi:hypothetical protein
LVGTIFVDDDDLDPIERSGAALDVIDEPARTYDEDVGALAQVVYLAAHRFATDDQYGLESGITRENHKLAQHLRR